MKFASFRAADRDRWGVLLDGGVMLDGSAALRASGVPDVEVPRTLLELLESERVMLEDVRTAVERAAAHPKAVARYPIADITWHPPVRRPSKICCLALNNSANSDRILSGPSHPAMFIKPASALVGHGGAIECKPQYGRTHPEPELAVVIGKTTQSIRAADAYSHVFGYTVHNDITSPTMRGEDTFQYRAIHPKAGDPSQIEYVDTWVSYPGRYKCTDTFSCMGPWVVTRDEIPDPHALTVRCTHQDRLVTEDTTANLTHKVPEVLAFLSDYLTLWPGDIVSMGTALAKSAGGGAVQNVDLNRLGGPVTVEIERIGMLTNTVRWGGAV
jgi:2-keto-4-pentenoate hydratase/2-oxohepta-3-ene-1,7-dioic acid hydratase in catechol pathway